jgi:hypothetical protein
MADIIGIPWCREEDYDAFRTLFENPNNLPPAWADFAKAAEDAEDHYQKLGSVIERVEINLKDFSDWCAHHSDGINSRAHFRFADWVAKHRHPDRGNASHS